VRAAGRRDLLQWPLCSELALCYLITVGRRAAREGQGHGLAWALPSPAVHLAVSAVGYGSWFEHVQEFWEHRMDANVLFLKYEDMHRVSATGSHCPRVWSCL
jgi:hypothetical protein